MNNNSNQNILLVIIFFQVLINCKTFHPNFSRRITPPLIRHLIRVILLSLLFIFVVLI